MYLKKVEIKGFKSFANKLELDFNQGITTIVGPNGSGKSNIVDAIRWVLGEQSMKTLRGAKGEEVIFAGTENRKPLGFAEVSLYLDNSTRLFNSDYEEVKITRCLYRTGESEYKINDANCRLKDIYDVFLNTGIGKEGYSIIGQGKIDEILSAKPKDRRSFFEEATGISKSRLDLNETNKKLEDEKANLLRINDIITEIENQIEPLRMQSEKATKYIEYRDELKKFELNLFMMDIEKFKKDYDEIKLRYDSLVMEVEEKTENLEFKQEEKRELSNILNTIRSDIELKANELNNAELKLEQMKHDKDLIGQKIENSKNSIEAKNENITRNNNMILAKKSMLQADAEKFKNTLEELESKKSYYDNESATVEKSDKIIADKEQELEDLKQSVIDMMNSTYAMRGEIQTYDVKIENIEENKNELSKQNEEVEKQISDLKTEKENLLNEKNFKKEEFSKMEISIKEKQDSNNKLIDEKNNLEYEKTENEKKAKSIMSKVEVLESMEKNFEGYNKGVKEVMTASKEGKIRGIIGTVSELISTDKDYEIALQVAYGARLQNIVCNSDGDAKYAINFLKQNKCGRATFMPLNAEKDDRDFDFSRIKSENGFIGCASDLIKVDEKYAKTIKGLVKNIAIVDTIDNATAISNKYKYSYNIVTLGGEQLTTNGAITGGEYKNQINFLSRQREITELKDEIENINNDIKSIMTKIDDANRTIDLAEIELVEMLNDKQELSFDILKLEEKMASCTKESDRLTDSIKDDIEQTAYYDSQKKMFEELKKEKEQEIVDTEKAIEDKNEEINKGKEILEAEKGIRDIKNEELVELKVSISALEREKALHDETIKGVQDEIELLEAERDESLKLVSVYENEIAEFNEKIKDIDNDNEKEIESRDALKKEHEALKIDLDVKQESYNAIETVIDSLLKEKEELNASLYKEESSLNTVTIKLENIRQKLLEVYNLTYEETLEFKDEDMSYNMAQTKVREFKGKISQLGNVNVDAIEQYQEMSTRYEFLKVQRDDIVEAERQLTVLIDHLLLEMRTQFSENLAKINEKFEKVFKELFGGGMAHIELTESEDVLESGIELIVCPPGKKVQNLSLLSGGERSLVAIALLFGIFSLKPSPFCILDEIEAALDEANVTRFADYIKKLSDKIQFLVITHRSGTMEAADYMYGVTMEEKGVSKVVSLELGNTEFADDTLPEDNKKVG
ncbi:MAG: chromosome segregation protein SMC [Clostridia bacterium]|nr:chromosome segregation protein SMC [Clostridia bacterium]